MPTFDVFAAAASGYVSSQSANPGVYGDAREGTGAATFVAYTAGGQAQIGQGYNTVQFPSSYTCRETFLVFDLSGFATITSAVLAVSNDFDNSTTDFVIEARAHPWTAPVDASDWVSGSALGGLTLAATYDTASGIPAAGTYYTLAGDLTAYCTPGGQARFLLCSSRHRLGNTPAANVGENVFIDMPPVPNPSPKLIVDGTKVGGWSVGVIRIA